eukprot:TRINITY_DN24822_c0_g1_i1.p1 TRINITY_DN24822_c0_g1~~TRINITY_DN24822_c0_g1_i1.p1  ORF type:complete len:624 (+),score=103.44 TRINITY_DN24822_c0_g1_i1:47-1873(+)
MQNNSPAAKRVLDRADPKEKDKLSDSVMRMQANVRAIQARKIYLALQRIKVNYCCYALSRSREWRVARILSVQPNDARCTLRWLDDADPAATEDLSIWNVKPFVVGHITQALYRHSNYERKWYVATIQSVDHQKATCQVRWVDYGVEEDVVAMCDIRLYKEGTLCQAPYSGDGRWYLGRIRQVHHDRTEVVVEWIEFPRQQAVIDARTVLPDLPADAWARFNRFWGLAKKGEHVLRADQFEMYKGRILSAAREQQRNPPAAEADPFDLQTAPELVTALRFDWDSKRFRSSQLFVKLDMSAPLSIGGMRAAFRMIDPSKPPGSRAFVAKIYQKGVEGDLLADVRMQAYCQQFARAYNECNPPKKVRFLEAFIIERANGTQMAVEPYLSGEYVKHNSNWGYVGYEKRNTPQCFSHFTYEYTKGAMIVVDIQGVSSLSVDFYTDPQIHSKDGHGLAFGAGNMGKQGFKLFFENHECNSLCQALKLKVRGRLDPSGGGLTVAPRHRTGYFIRKYRPSEFCRHIDPIRDRVLVDDLVFLGISLEHFNRFVDYFNHFDTDKDGFLEIAEMWPLLDELGFTYTESALEELASGMDKDADGRVSFVEFICWWNGLE